MLVTSREPLARRRRARLPGAAAGAAAEPGPAVPRRASPRYEAVELFVERARAVQPDFGLTDENAPRWPRSVGALDGLPLAIELAAARVALLPPAQSRAAGQRLTLLTGGARDLPDVSGRCAARSTGATSCSRAEQAPLRALRGLRRRRRPGSRTGRDRSGWLGSATDPIDLLAALVDRSLLRSTRAARAALRDARDDPRVRPGTADRIGERQTICDRHADHYAAVASAARYVLSSPDRRERLDQLDVDMPNFREAIEWSVESRNAARGESFAVGLKDFWRTRNHLVEARRLIDTIVASLPADAERERAYIVGIGAELHRGTRTTKPRDG